MKIPTELLVLSAFFAGVHIIRTGAFIPSLIPGMLTGAVFLAVRKKFFCGLYDILLIVMLAVLLQDPGQQLRVIALLLILWGAAGAVTRCLNKKKDRHAIPLVPVIMISYTVVSRFTLP